MQYVRNLSDSVSTAWNSINPATLSGAIDVIVVEQEDGSLMCSPFHVRFGKFSLLRPYEKKVEFKVNGVRQDYSMKLGEGGEAFFVFETTDNIPQSMQTSPISSPVSSPSLGPEGDLGLGLGLGLGASQLQEPELLALDSAGTGKSRSSSYSLRSPPTVIPAVSAASAQQRNGLLTPLSASPETCVARPKTGDWSAWTQRSHSDDLVPQSLRRTSDARADSADGDANSARRSERSRSPPPLAPQEALERALTLSRELSAINIPSRVTEAGDLMLDLTGFKGSEEDALRAEIIARRVLSNELQGNYDVGALFGMDEQGNLWIYSSEEAKEAAMKRVMESSMGSGGGGSGGVGVGVGSGRPSGALDAASDPGYQSDDSSSSAPGMPNHRRTESDTLRMVDRNTPPSSPGLVSAVGDPNRNYAKTLRLTSDQLKALDLQPGENTMSFTVNRATCSAYMYLWKNDVPVVISDIDGTITKSDALGHVLNMIGRDWTHAGVAKLYSDIVANGYNIMYLTSRSVGQADSTRTYLHGILQGGYRLPRGPTILSPDRTMAALRREIYLRKPEVFKMATLRDIRNLYGSNSHPFYAGFGNRLTDQISYRTVDVPRNRIFTINANAEVSLDLLSLNQLKLTYVNITEVVDHYFPPVSTLVKGGGEDYTDFRYWRDAPLELDDFSASESDDDDHRGRRTTATHGHSRYDEDDDEEEDDEDDEDEDDEDIDDEEAGEGMGDSYISHNSMDDYGEGSFLSGEYDDQHMIDSIIADEREGGYEDDDEDAYDDEEEGDEGEDEGEEEEEVGDAGVEVEGEGEGKGEGENEGESERLDDSALAARLAGEDAEDEDASPPADGRVSEASQTTSSTMEDVDAEVITGISNLSVEVVPPRENGSAAAL